MIAYGFITFILALAIRLRAASLNKGRGSDAYYFLMCREEARKNFRFPPFLPRYFVLEEQKQWYPPGFVYLLALLPENLMEKWFWGFSPLVDALVALSVFAVSVHVGAQPNYAFLASCFYALSSSGVQEARFLTSRQLGTLIFFLATWRGLIAWSIPTDITVQVIFLLLWGLLLLTHKLSTQAMWVVVLPACLSLKSWLPMGEVVGGMFIWAILTGGVYAHIFWGHWGFIKFWTRNAQYLGAHQVYDSKEYGHIKRRPLLPVFTLSWSENLRRFVKLCPAFFLSNGSLLISLYLVIIGHKPGGLWNWVALSVALFSMGTHLLPFLRGFGFFTQYGKLALVISLVGVAQADDKKALLLLAAMTLVQAYFAYRHWMGPSKEVYPGKEEEKEQMLQSIQSLQPQLLWCFPNNLSDMVVYRCRVPTLRGTHGSPIERSEDIYPVLTADVATLCRKHGVSHILVDINYVDPTHIGLTGSSWANAKYELYTV